MSVPNYHQIAVRERAWRLLRRFVAFTQVGAGVGILWNGSATFTLPQFEPHAGLFVWWWWGATAIASGLLILVRRIRLIGLGLSALWWSTWSSLLIVGILLVGQPIVSAFTYLLIIFVHVLLAGIEYDRWRDGDR